ncbi:hypothetical protein [Salidesulfovibrio brasiliensis]|uniref:hypothetical protein n=1 Tax=Salidesulfovibrio brasiliensis TaxID=221711 RepID=UPI0006D0E8D9|nr:hypothetical protein [Salidesulfovibrio brasiliensis]
MGREVYDLEDLGVECSLKTCKKNIVLHLSNGVSVEGVLRTDGSVQDLLNGPGGDFFKLEDSRCLHGTFCSSGETLVINRRQVVFAEDPDEG